MADETLVVEDATVDELMIRYPATMAVFNAYGVDTCCGASRSVRDACAHDGADESALIKELHEVIASGR